MHRKRISTDVEAKASVAEVRKHGLVQRKPTTQNKHPFSRSKEDAEPYIFDFKSDNSNQGKKYNLNLYK